jgi:hypothetical protein
MTRTKIKIRSAQKLECAKLMLEETPPKNKYNIWHVLSLRLKLG